MMTAGHQSQRLPYRIVASFIETGESWNRHMVAHPLDIVGEENKDGVTHLLTDHVDGFLVIVGRADIEVFLVFFAEIVATSHTDTDTVGLGYRTIQLAVVVKWGELRRELTE